MVIILCSTSTEYLEHLQQIMIMTEIVVRDENVTVGILGEDLPYSMYHQNISFELTIMPQAPVIVTDEDMTATLSYNIQYNLTVLGSLCGYTSSVNFFYGEIYG